MQALMFTYLIAIVALATSLVTAALGFQELDAPRFFGIKGLITRAVVDIDTVYHKATCKGEKLLAATTSPHDSAAAYINPIDSPWTNPIHQDLNTWGYKIDTDDGTAQWRAHHDDECEFAHNHKLKGMFDDLGIDTRSTWQNGPNRCYFVNHKDGPAVQRLPNGYLLPVNQQWYNVNGRQYRITNAEFTIGVNPGSGLIVMTNRQSPGTSAKALWGLPNLPPSNQLPALKSSSDIMWGLWSLASPNNLRGIKYMLSTPVTNDETVAIIERVLQDNCLELDELMEWSGCEFAADELEYLPLLGSPNGLAVGYFLAQHKRQLGGKYVSKINIFRADTNTDLAICLLFTIEDKVGASKIGTGSDATGVDRVDEAVVVEREGRRKNLVRHHIVWARF